MLISRTPFRFSLIGGGSDLPAYYTEYGPAKIISMTLSASMYVTYSPRDLYSDRGAISNLIRLSYTQTENVDRIQDLKHDLVRSVLETLRYECATDSDFESFEMTTIADIPSRGSGLGSSSALIVGILKLFLPKSGGAIPLENLANLAFRIETEKLGKNIGFQDHYSATFGGLRKYHRKEYYVDAMPHFNKDPRLVGHDLAYHLCAFRLPVNRSSDAANVPEQQTLNEMKKKMKVRAQYITETVDMVDDMWRALEKRDFGDVGRILGKAWELKKASHDIIDKNLDRLYNLGIEAGALAGKVSGSMSGGAGHLFFLAYPDDHDRIRQAMKELVEMRVEYYPHGVTVTRI